MNADFHDYLHSNLTDKIIKAFYNGYNKLGYGFLEKVYENALAIELRLVQDPKSKERPFQILKRKNRFYRIESASQ
jgi:GxxExxY protein